MQISKNISVSVFGTAFVALVLLALSFSLISNIAYASDLPDDGGWVSVYPDQYVDVYPDQYSTVYPDQYSTIYPDSYSNYGGGYSNPASYSSGSMPGFSGGWYLGGGSSGYGGGLSNSNTNVNTNTNTCTAGSCNTAINAPTTVVTNSYPQTQPVYSQPIVYTQPPVVYNQPPIYNTCNTCGCPGYQACYRPIAQAPYVTLAAVPYTGLELGPVGTALYWGFLVLWCLLAAYLIAVKKVQNRIAAWVTSKKAPIQTVVAHAPIAHKVETVVIKSQYAGIDPFIASQISRAN